MMKRPLFAILLLLLIGESNGQSGAADTTYRADILFHAKNIIFEFDKAVLKPTSFHVLDSIAVFLKTSPEFVVEVQNHSDGRDREHYSRNLTEDRAESIRDYLISRGISPERITAKGYGPTKPLVPLAEISKMKTKAEQEEAYSKNRRTDFVFREK